MKRREWIFAGFGIVLLGTGAHLARMSPGGVRDTVLVAACRTPIRILEPQAPRPIGSAVVFHGLSANRRLMQTFGQWLAALGLRVYLVDSPGHGDSTEPFSLGRAEQCAAAVLESLAQSGKITPDRTVLVGHSMGGAIAVRLADRFPGVATIAVSPAPMNLPRRMPANLLIFSAQFDLVWMKGTAQKLLRAAGGERQQPEDFRERRAVKLQVVPWATHTSLLFNRRVCGMSADWARNALDENSPEIIPPGFPVGGGALGLAGLLLLFPLAASGLTALFHAGASEPALAPPKANRLLVRWAVAAFFAVGVLKFWAPLQAVRLLTGGYLASFLLLAGAVLLALLWKEGRVAIHFDLRATATSCVLGLASVLACGAWLNWQLTDAWLNTARWLRFVPLVLVCLPYFAAEDLALGPPEAGRPLRRFGLFLVLRLTLWLALVFALFASGSGQILVLLLSVYLAAISLLQRWGTDAVRRRTGSLAAAAMFGAILAAWFIAAIFPLT